MIQPLSYQQQNSSCCITSFMNGLVLILKGIDKIPNEIARILYSVSSRHGTNNREADRIANIINAYDMDIKCQVYQKEETTPKRLKKILSNDSVVVSDVENGAHSVLITGICKEGIKVFDPYWYTVKMGLKNKVSGAKFNITEPTYNAIVNEKEFFKERSSKNGWLSMGKIKSRYWVQLLRTSK